MMLNFSGSPEEWDRLIARLPEPHLLQTWEWSRVKAEHGWEPLPLCWGPTGSPTGATAAAMLMRRRLPMSWLAGRLSVLYCPKGPLLDWSDRPLRHEVLDDLQTLARRVRAVFLKLDADIVLSSGEEQDSAAEPNMADDFHQSDLRARGWRYSRDQIQFKNTVVVDLRATDEELLARMKPKTRYNIRVAERKGVHVRPATVADLPSLFRLYAETSLRDGFAIRHEEYYRDVWTTFMRPPPRERHEPWCEPLLAEVDGTTVAAVFVFFFADRAYYLYGMSTAHHREKMPNHLLQWEAMRLARGRGCAAYDLWGAPDRFDEGDRMWGVFRFKEGLGGHVVRTAGAWDFVPNQFWYGAYTRLVPWALAGLRLRGRPRTREGVAGMAAN